MFKYYSKVLHSYNLMNNSNHCIRVIWSRKEDDALMKNAIKYKERDWQLVHKQIVIDLPHFRKTAKQCRERWGNFTNPAIQKSKWTDEEIDVLFEVIQKNGNKWSMVRDKLKGRTDHAIKNIYYCKIRKLIRRIAFLNTDDEELSDTKEIDRLLYCLADLLYQYIQPLEANKKVIGDQYVVKFVKQYEISEKQFYKFTSKLYANAPITYKAYVKHKQPALFKNVDDSQIPRPVDFPSGSDEAIKSLYMSISKKFESHESTYSIPSFDFHPYMDINSKS
jgi:hypothetical protein